MRSIFLILTLAFALVACNGKGSSTTPKVPTPKGPVTADSLTAYFQVRFPAAVSEGTLILDFGSAGVASDVINELGILGIDDMSAVADLVPPDFDTKGFGAYKTSSATTTIAGLMRELMIMRDIRAYFEKAWQSSWVTSGPQDFPASVAYGVDFKVAEELGVFGGDGGDDPCDFDPCAGDPCGDPYGD